MADRFLYKAFEEKLPSVLWVVQLDPRGASSLVHRCKQARTHPHPQCEWGGAGGGPLQGVPPATRHRDGGLRWAVRGGTGVRAAGVRAGRGRVQVSYVESSKFGDAEAEFLFAPYSTFTVVSVEPSASNSYFAPHVITLAAAVDNHLEPEDLPLAPWY